MTCLGPLPSGDTALRLRLGDLQAAGLLETADSAEVLAFARFLRLAPGLSLRWPRGPLRSKAEAAQLRYALLAAYGYEANTEVLARLDHLLSR